jgi:hypothetical protein
MHIDAGKKNVAILKVESESKNLPDILNKIKHYYIP